MFMFKDKVHMSRKTLKQPALVGLLFTLLTNFNYTLTQFYFVANKQQGRVNSSSLSESIAFPRNFQFYCTTIFLRLIRKENPVNGCSQTVNIDLPTVKVTSSLRQKRKTINKKEVKRNLIHSSLRMLALTISALTLSLIFKDPCFICRLGTIQLAKQK